MFPVPTAYSNDDRDFDFGTTHRFIADFTCQPRYFTEKYGRLLFTDILIPERIVCPNEILHQLKALLAIRDRKLDTA